MKIRNLIHSDNWKTPDWFYEKLNKEFEFDFDPCPYFEGEIPKNKNGLLIDWGKSNFVNPPYSEKLKELFVRKAIEESGKGKKCVMLLPVSTSSKLFHDHILPNASEIRFIKKRIKFQKMRENGSFYTPKDGAMHDSMIVIFDNTKIKQQQIKLFA